MKYIGTNRPRPPFPFSQEFWPRRRLFTLQLIEIATKKLFLALTLNTLHLFVTQKGTGFLLFICCGNNYFFERESSVQVQKQIKVREKHLALCKCLVSPCEVAGSA